MEHDRALANARGQDHHQGVSDQGQASLLEYLTAGARVCPTPRAWHRMYAMLSGDPPLPPILGTWYEGSPAGKARALEEHVRYAAEHDCLDEVERFLRELRNDEWLRAPRGVAACKGKRTKIAADSGP